MSFRNSDEVGNSNEVAVAWEKLRFQKLFAWSSCTGCEGVGSASRLVLYLSCPDLKPGEADASLRQLNIDSRNVSFDQLLIEGWC